MLNLNRISPIADFCSKINSQLKVLNANVLYTTHEIDKIKKIVTALQTDTGLQKQVDEYFEDDQKDTPVEELADKQQLQ